MDNISIVGCGTVGASLALKIARGKLVTEMDLYDFDHISAESKQPTYPFLEEESGLLKVKVIQFQCKMIDENLVVRFFPIKVIKPIDLSFVIDCRDCKYPDIKANIRISLDGYLLYIDSLTKIGSVKDYHRYISPRDEKYINQAMSIVVEYLKNDEFIFKDFRFYDLRNNTQHLLEWERNKWLHKKK